MRALCINRGGAINEISHTEQTALLAHVVETGLLFRPNKTAIEHCNDDSSAIKALVVQLVNFQLLHLGFGTAIVATETALALDGLHFVGQPAFFDFLRLQVVGAIAHHRHKLKRIDGLNHSGVGCTHRNAVQPFRRIEQLGTAIGHSLKILRIDGNVVLINANALIGTTLQSPCTQISLGIVNRIR